MIEKNEAMRIAYGLPGMQWPAELGWLYDAFNASMRHVEIGSHCGRSLFTVAAGSTGAANLFAVDHFGEAVTGPDWARSVFGATKGLIESRTDCNVELLEMGSVEAFRALWQRKVRVDSVFIDATHHYAECKADIQMWSQIVRPGGLIAGHDYWPVDAGVMDAVNETGPFEVIPGTRIWHRRA